MGEPTDGTAGTTGTRADNEIGLSRFERRLAQLRAGSADVRRAREQLRLWSVAGNLLLDEQDDATVMARAVASVRAALPAGALGAATDFLAPVRARGKSRRNLGFWDLQLCADDAVQLAAHKDALAGAGWHVLAETVDFAGMDVAGVGRVDCVA